MAEHRKSFREQAIFPAISGLLKLSDGTTREGSITDLSDDGAKITGAVAGLKKGDKVRLVLVIQTDQKIAYECEVRHVDLGGQFCGLRFLSPPQPLEETQADCVQGYRPQV